MGYRIDNEGRPAFFLRFGWSTAAAAAAAARPTAALVQRNFQLSVPPHCFINRMRYISGCTGDVKVAYSLAVCATLSPP